MGKMLGHQRRGKASPAYITPGHRYLAPVHYPALIRNNSAKIGQVTAVKDDPGRTTLVVEVLTEDGERFLNLAAEGLAVGDKFEFGPEANPGVGAILPLEKVPDGSFVFNIEITPGDGGRVCRSGGSSALLVSHDEETGLVNVQFASKNTVKLSPKCFVTMGVPSCGGHTEKPFRKAGSKRAAMAARNRRYPKVRGTAMSAYAHPHGGRSFGKPTTISRHAPPGQKVGHIAARATGRRKSRRRS